MKRTLVVEKRLVVGRATGKQHGPIVGKGFKLNPPEVLSTHVQEQLDQAAQMTPESWRWWQFSDELIIEKSPTDGDFVSSPTFYYLPKRHWKITQGRSLYFEEVIDWSVHIADIIYQPIYECWFVNDLFVDIMIRGNNQTLSVLDLDDLAEVFEVELISKHKLVQILRDTQALIDLIRSGNFPPREIEECQRFWIESVWKNSGLD